MSKTDIFSELIESEKKNPSVYGNDEDKPSQRGFIVEFSKNLGILLIGVLIGLTLMLKASWISVVMIMIGVYFIWKISKKINFLKYKIQFAMACITELFKTVQERPDEDTYYGVRAILRNWKTTHN